MHLYLYLCLFIYIRNCFRPDLASSGALEKSVYVVVHHKSHLIELLAWFCERRLMQPSCLNMFIFAFYTVSFTCTCLSLHLSKTTMNPLPNFNKFYRTQLSSLWSYR